MNKLFHNTCREPVNGYPASSLLWRLFLIPEQPDHLSLLVSFPVVFPLLQIFLQFPLFAVLPFALFLPCFPRYSLLSSFLLSFFTCFDRFQNLLNLFLHLFLPFQIFQCFFLSCSVSLSSPGIVFASSGF